MGVLFLRWRGSRSGKDADAIATALARRRTHAGTRTSGPHLGGPLVPWSTDGTSGLLEWIDLDPIHGLPKREERHGFSPVTCEVGRAGIPEGTTLLTRISDRSLGVPMLVRVAHATRSPSTHHRAGMLTSASCTTT